MKGVLGFVIEQMCRRTFWYLVLASFTMVFMLSWRTFLRNEIFQHAAGKFDRPRYY